MDFFVDLLFSPVVTFNLKKKSYLKGRETDLEKERTLLLCWFTSQMF